jgi:large subunit ribosomal protein L4
VRGGKAKPYRQKGTGRARQGSTNAPHMIKGGVAFAPKPRDFSKKVNKKMKQAAMRSALSQKLRDGQFIIVDKFTIDQPKTKLVVAILEKFDAQKTTLLVMNGEQQDVLRAGNNIENLSMTDATLLSLYDLVRVNKCIITKDAVQTLTEVLA